jgi:hypothetical protein
MSFIRFMVINRKIKNGKIIFKNHGSLAFNHLISAACNNIISNRSIKLE